VYVSGCLQPVYLRVSWHNEQEYETLIRWNPRVCKESRISGQSLTSCVILTSYLMAQNFIFLIWKMTLRVPTPQSWCKSSMRCTWSTHTVCGSNIDSIQIGDLHWHLSKSYLFKGFFSFSTNSTRDLRQGVAYGLYLWTMSHIYKSLNHTLHTPMEFPHYHRITPFIQK
jgi:hypothetical protein